MLEGSFIAMAYVICMVFLVIGVAVACNYVLDRWGQGVLAIVVAAFAVVVWLVSIRFYWIPTAYIGDRPFAFYRVHFIGLSICAIAITSLVLASRGNRRLVRVSASSVVGFIVAWCGGVVT